jgi:uncharacterized 2Fe-2S/4Fe-4S cluster protein (DUF4445 family)
VIGNVPPVGFCGSALLDTAAELRRSGILEETGRLLGPEELPTELPAGLASRVIEGTDGPEFVIARGTETRTGESVALTQRDLREMQLAVGAIRAGITVLLEEAGVAVGQLKRLLLAGGFGNYIRRSNAQVVGLLPPEMERRRIRFIGNASLAGARRAAVSGASRETAARIARSTRHVDISRCPEFQTIFSEAMIMPDPAISESKGDRSQSRRLSPVGK